MSPLSLRAQLTQQVLVRIGLCAVLAGGVWSIGPFSTSVSRWIALAILAVVVWAMWMARSGRVRLAAGGTTGVTTVALIGAVSMFWGIAGHNVVLLTVPLVIAALLTGARGTLGTLGVLLVYVVAEGLFGRAPWGTSSVATDQERMIDLAVSLGIVAALLALFASSYDGFLVRLVRREADAADALERLVREEAFSRRLIRCAPVPMALVEGTPGQERITRLNDAARALLDGTPPTDMPLADWLRDADGDDARWFGPPRCQRIPVAVEEASIEGRNGRRVFVLHDLRPIREADSQRREALATALAANRAKSGFLASVSHELRTPLNAIRGYGELLEEDLDDPQHREDVGRILSSAAHLLRLVDEVLDLSRVEAGKLELEIQPLVVADVLRDVESSMAVVAGRKGCRLEVQANDEPGVVLGDPTRVRQILLNLVANAVKFATGRVQLAVATDAAGFVRIGVRDDGPGVPDGLVPRLFEPFARGSSAASGTGLGLALSRELALRMGGEVAFEGVGLEGTGAGFSLALPAVQNSSTRLTRDGVLGSSGPGSGSA
jgi:signal transduction histidine kinase